MRFYVFAVSSLLWIVTVQATPTGNHTCTGVVKHSVTVRVNVTEPVTYRTYTWCLRVPPRCSKYTVQLKDRVKIHTEMHNRTITVCCKGYVEIDYKCVPACPPQTECPNMHCNRTNHCYCTPGYQGLYCNYPCDRGFWGTDCKKTCDCPTGFTCHHLTGDCMIDDRPTTKSRRTTTTTVATISPETKITERSETTDSALITESTTRSTIKTTPSSTTSSTTEFSSTTTHQTQSTVPSTTSQTTPTTTVVSTTKQIFDVITEAYPTQHTENKFSTIINNKFAESQDIPKEVTDLVHSSTVPSKIETESDVNKKLPSLETFPAVTMTTVVEEETTTQTRAKTVTEDLYRKLLPDITLDTSSTGTTSRTTLDPYLERTLEGISPSKTEIITELTTLATTSTLSSTVESVSETNTVPKSALGKVFPVINEDAEIISDTISTTLPSASSTTLPTTTTLPTLSSTSEEIEVTTTSPTIRTTTTTATPHSTETEMKSFVDFVPTTASAAPNTSSELMFSTSSTLLSIPTLLDKFMNTPRTLITVDTTQNELMTSTLPSYSTLFTSARTIEDIIFPTESTTLGTSSTKPSALNEETISTFSKPPSTLTSEKVTSTVESTTLSTTKSPLLTSPSSSINYITTEFPTSVHSPTALKETFATESSSTHAFNQDKSTEKYNKNNVTLKEHSSFTTPIMHTVQIAVQINTDSDQSAESTKTSSTLNMNDKTTDPHVRRTISTPSTVDISNLSPITTSKEISETAESSTFKTTTTQPDREVKIKNNTEAVNTYYEATTELLQTKKTDVKDELEERRNMVKILTNEDNHSNQDVPSTATTLTTTAEAEVFRATEPKSVTTETTTFDFDKLFNRSELKKSSPSTMKTYVTKNILERNYKNTNIDNDSVFETTNQEKYNETLKMSNRKKTLQNATHSNSGLNEVSTKIEEPYFDVEKSADDNRLNGKLEVTTTSVNKVETNSNNLWQTTNSRPAHTWYSHIREYQRKVKNKDDVKTMRTTSHFDLQLATEKYDMSEESNVIDSMLTTFSERGSRSNSGAPPYANEETNVPSSYMRNGQIKYNLSSALAEEVQAGRSEKSMFALYSASTLISGVALILLISASTTLWYCLRRNKEPTTLRGPCIMAYEGSNEFSINPLMYETVYPLESIKGEPCIDPDIFFCPTFTNNYAEKINRELSELNYDHPRSSICEPLYAEIHY